MSGIQAVLLNPKFLFSIRGLSAISVKSAFLLLLAIQLITREEYQPAEDYVTTQKRGQYQVQQCDSANCYDIDNACQKTVRGTPLEFDFIVIGSGAAGSTLARQLLDSPKNWKILLVEAGGDQKTDSVVPQFFPFTYNCSNAWNHTASIISSSSNAFKNGTPMFHGRQLGGSTGTNAMMYVCGNDRDYDGWAASGNTGWDYESILPYIKKSEGNTDSSKVGNGTYHGTSGNLTVTSFQDENPIIPKLEQAFQDLGYPILSDYNARQYIGIVKLQGTVRGGERCSSYRAFIAPVKNHKNLYIMKDSHAIKINFNGTTATSVIVNTKHAACPVIELIPKKEVIVSAGGLVTPKLLQLSGIGRAGDLAPFGIKQIKDLNVGHNLMDHVYSINFFTLNPNSTRQMPVENLLSFYQYYNNRSGPLSLVGTSNVNAFINTLDSNATYPDIQLVPTISTVNQPYFAEMLANYGYKDEHIAYLLDVNKRYDILMFYVVILQPFSRGSVKLRSSDSAADPLITSGYYTDQKDVDTQLRGIYKLLELMKTDAMQRLSPRPLKMPIPECDFLQLPCDLYLRCYIKYFSASLFHPSGTCKMGRSSDPDAVVDPTLKVHGFTNLRVVDASIMPMITTGNTQCPTYMIGQKAADMIKADWT